MGWSREFAYRDCPWCHTRSVAMNQPVGPFQVSAANGSPREWTGLSCPRCASLTLIETYVQESPHIKNVFPEVVNEGVQVVDHLPTDVERLYTDAQKVLRAGHPDAAVVQLRRTLEAAAAHVDITEKTLAKSIAKLMERGLITQSFEPALHHVREIGNVGAHYTVGEAPVDDEAAQRVLRFTTQVLRNLYEVPGELRVLAGEGNAGGGTDGSGGEQPPAA